MVQNNKVLTVSYGTFSCTLEGFEDSFDTMKAIAEYFRDLAADDRYFGAEPPQPDTEMLARIAEREISRQVEARRDASGIVLRAAQPLAAPLTAGVSAPSPEPPAAEPTPEPKAEQAEAPPATEVEMPAAEPAAEAEETAPAAPAEAFPEATALEAAIIEAEEEAEAAEPRIVPAEEDMAQDLSDAALEETEALAETAAEAEAEDEAELAAALAEEVLAEDEHEAEAEAEHETEARTEDEHEAEAEPDFEPMVAEAIAPETEATIEEIEHALEAEAETSEEIEAPEARGSEIEDPKTGLRDEAEEEAALEAISARLAADEEDMASQTETGQDIPLAEPVEPEDEIVPFADSIAAKLQRIRAVVSRQERLAGDEYDEDEHAQDILSQAPAHEEEEAPEAPIEDALFTDLDMDDEDGNDSDDLKNILEDDARAEAAAEPSAEPAEGEKRIARVLKVKQRDVAAALASGEMEEVAEDEEDTPAPAGSLSPEDEEDLMRELAEVEAELRGHDTQDEEDEDTLFGPGEEDYFDADSEEEAATEEASLPPLPAEEANGEDLARLMEAADLKLDDPERTSNRETYSHLRAAVAAAQAERQAGGTVGTHPDDDPYREDLAEVVRPRRPVASGGAERPRPGSDRPAPLKLVAEQRVDAPAAAAEPVAPRGPVRPRRIPSVTEPLAETDAEGGFAAYAEEHGATSLADLLEAAAAYLSFVEGQEQFSRPQLMNKVRGVRDEDFNREDGLRSFGQLLREGKIEKTGGGRFAASGRIGFRPDERAVG